MGRAFVGLSDDASAAITNPAGLTFTENTQFYFEYKNTDFSTLRLAGSQSFFSRETTKFGENVNSASFLNVSWRPSEKKFVLAFTVHEFLKFEERFSNETRSIPDLTTGFPETGPLPNEVFTPVPNFLPGDIDIKFQARSFAGTIAYGEADDPVKIGVTVAASRLNVNTRLTRFPENQGSGALIFSESTIQDSDWNVGFTAGVLTGTDRFSVGAAYSRGPSFDLLIEAKACGGGSRQVLRESNFADFPKPLEFNVPDRLQRGHLGTPQGHSLFSPTW